MLFFILFSPNDFFTHTFKVSNFITSFTLFPHFQEASCPLRPTHLLSPEQSLQSGRLQEEQDNMSMFTQTTTGRVDQLGSLSQKHKHTKHTKYKHTAQSHTGTWWSPEIGTKSWPAIALMVVATLGEQFSQKTWEKKRTCKGDKSTEHNILWKYERYRNLLPALFKVLEHGSKAFSSCVVDLGKDILICGWFLVSRFVCFWGPAISIHLSHVAAVYNHWEQGVLFHKSEIGGSLMVWCFQKNELLQSGKGGSPAIVSCFHKKWNERFISNCVLFS